MAAIVTPLNPRYLEISGSTSDVKSEMIAQSITKVEGYFVDTSSGNRYILARRD